MKQLRRSTFALLVILSLLLPGCVQKHSRIVPSDQYEFCINSVDVSPDTISRGGEVTLTVTYTVRNAHVYNIYPMGKIAIWKSGKLLSVLKEAKCNTNDGTWQDYITFEIDRNIKPGIYQVKVVISDGSEVFHRAIFFTVQ